MIENKEYDCKEMFRHACAFCEVADMAMEKFQHETADISWYVDPAEVNSAFACEVFLKAILKWHDIEKKKVHKLKELHGLLPAKVQEYIHCCVLNEHGGWTNAFGQNLLELVSNDFEKCRYLYEHNLPKQGSVRIYTGFLEMYRNILRDVCCHLFYGISWDEYKRG